MPASTLHRRLPIGAEVQSDGGAHFRVWAPDWPRVEVLLEPEGRQPEAIAMEAEPEGYFSVFAPQADAGTRYRYRLDGQNAYPDPASRWQPEGPHGPSVVVDPSRYRWHDADWPGVRLEGQIVYEMHLGTFTEEGTFAAAETKLADLATLGITLIEVMPVAEFQGRFGWGYDGVDLFAPEHVYGTPDDFRHLVDTAHRLGLGVVLDVVYNHFGPVGNYTYAFARDYLSPRHVTEWGAGLNFDGPRCGPVREFITANAGYWIDEYHLDGLRMDAIHAIIDDSPDHITAAIARQVHRAAGGRGTVLIAENEAQDARIIRHCGRGGCGVDAAWNDDFHHAAKVAATGRNEAYYADYTGSPQELISAVRHGYLYQGQWNARQGRYRGSPALDLAGPQFVLFLDNHDQVANSARGRRLHRLTSPGRYRALTTLLLLAPGTPMLFQGQEFAADAPFLYFADHEPELAELVRRGRQEFLTQFASMAGPQQGGFAVDPCSEETFRACRLDWSDRERHGEVLSLHRDLIRLRREDPVFAAQRSDRIDGAVIGPEALLLRYFGPDDDDRLVLVNLGRDIAWGVAAEPLAAPPLGAQWEILFSSEDPRYGGGGVGVLDTRQWRVPGHATVVLKKGEGGRGKAESV